MTFNEALGLRNGNIEIATERELSHAEKYSRIIDFLGGIDVIRPCIPYLLYIIKEKIEEDPNLNNTDLKKWDAAAGYRFFIHRGTEMIQRIPSRLKNIINSKGITTYSCSECVCILKEAARILCHK